MVYAEPYYSRKDDVPERPREFAGKVFRILHKDSLQVRKCDVCCLFCAPPSGDKLRAVVAAQYTSATVPCVVGYQRVLASFILVATCALGDSMQQQLYHCGSFDAGLAEELFFFLFAAS